MLNDLTFVDARSGEAQTFIVATLVGVAIIVAAIATILGFVFLRGWMATLQQAVADMRAGRPPSLLQRDRTVVTDQIQKLLKDLEVGRTPTETSQTQWTPQSLHDLLGSALPGAEVIITLRTANPTSTIGPTDGIELQTPASGLVTALEPVMRACGGTWIAHGSGTADHETVDEDDRLDVPPGSAVLHAAARLAVTEEEQDRLLLRLLQRGPVAPVSYRLRRPTFRDSDWEALQAVNQRFAEAVARGGADRRSDRARAGLSLRAAAADDPQAPAARRRSLPSGTSRGPTPRPSASARGGGDPRRPARRSIVGFHTQFHCNNFFETVDRFIESRIDREHSAVTLNGHETLIRPYPISIEWPPKAMENQPDIATCRQRVRARLKMPDDHKIAVGIERFDYTKGILDRMQSIDILLAASSRMERAVQLRPGRGANPQQAARLRASCSARRSRWRTTSTRRHGKDDWQPIRLLIRHHEPAEVFELFRGADLCIVSSLHDGMNLVAKEFVASRDDDQGVLILSSFAGASREMSEALIVNPYDGEDMSQALNTALIMPAAEQAERMRLMRQQVREQNVYRWAGRMLVDAARIRQRRRIIEISGRS